MLVARAARAALEEAAGDTGEDGEAKDDNDPNDRAGQCPWVDLAAVAGALSAADLFRARRRAESPGVLFPAPVRLLPEEPTAVARVDVLVGTHPVGALQHTARVARLRDQMLRNIIV